MMTWLRNPKNVKTITLVVAAIFVLGIAFTGVSSFGNTASAAPAASSIAVVDVRQVSAESADYQALNDALNKEYAQLQSDFEAKSATMKTDNEKQEYFQQLQQRLAQKESELGAQWAKKLDAAIKKAAESKGYTVVLRKTDVLYGGADITAEVIKQLNGK